MKRKVGRPPLKQHEKGDRVAFSLRVSSACRAAIERAAEESGRSLSQECELRLELSFDREATVREVLRQQRCLS